MSRFDTVRLALAGSALALAVTVAGDAFAEPPPEESPHVYTFNLRGAAWIATLQGDVSGITTSDFGLDDFQPGAVVNANLRFGKHDLMARFRYYGNDGSESSVVLGIPVEVSSQFDIYALDLRYYYSFWKIEDHGFRLGPGIGVALLFPDFRFREAATGFSETFDQFVPAPTLRLRGEVPIWRSLLLEVDAGGFYLPPIGSDNLEGWMVEVEGNIVWRPFGHLGLFAGVNWFHIGGRDDTSLDLNLDLVGPQVGFEVRF